MPLPLFNLYFFFTNKPKFFFILFTASIAAAPFKSVVELAAEADVLGTLSVRVEETLILLKFKPSSLAIN